MQKTFLTLVLYLVIATGSFAGTRPETTLDSNAAFFEGEELNYVIFPPENFRMELDSAVMDGYSFAFLPEDEPYYQANLVIGVNFYKIRGMNFETALENDTLNVRSHYGKGIDILPVDSVFCGSGEIIPTFFLKDESGFIPNVMLSYFDGGTEMIIFELVVTDQYPTFAAEDLFMQCLNRFKALPIGDLGYEENSGRD